MSRKFNDGEVATIVGTYEASADGDYTERSQVVTELAAVYEVTVNVIRAKLVAEGVYKAKEAGSKATKDTKETTRKAFEAVTGLNLVSMEKMTKKELDALWTRFVQMSERVNSK